MHATSHLRMQSCLNQAAATVTAWCQPPRTTSAMADKNSVVQKSVALPLAQQNVVVPLAALKAHLALLEGAKLSLSRSLDLEVLRAKLLITPNS